MIFSFFRFCFDLKVNTRINESVIWNIVLKNACMHITFGSIRIFFCDAIQRCVNMMINHPSLINTNVTALTHSLSISHGSIILIRRKLMRRPHVSFEIESKCNGGGNLMPLHLTIWGSGYNTLFDIHVLLFTTIIESISCR